MFRRSAKVARYNNLLINIKKIKGNATLVTILEKLSCEEEKVRKITTIKRQITECDVYMYVKMKFDVLIFAFCELPVIISSIKDVKLFPVTRRFDL